MNAFFKSSIGRKIMMALSALFLIVFLLQHLSINMLSVVSGELFNEVSHFMGTNPIGQFILQPILMFGVLFHFVMGFVLEIQNKGARKAAYKNYSGALRSSWMSRNMIFSGMVILAFLGLHLYDFWIPEMKLKFVEGVWNSNEHYYPELLHRFEHGWRVAIYCISFVFLALHLWHGFSSSFQSVGIYQDQPWLKTASKLYAVIIPSGFVFIALFHYLSHGSH